MTTSRAFSTIEILFAMTILLMTLSGMVVLTSENGSLLLDMKQSAIASNLAEAMLYKSRKSASIDIDLVYATTSTITKDGFSYEESIDTRAWPHTKAKTLTATVSWLGSHGERSSVSLDTIIADLGIHADDDTCDATIQGDWSHPTIVNDSTSFADIVHDPSGLYPITSIDAFDGRLYVTVNNSNANTADTFFILSTTTQLLGALDNAPVAAGLIDSTLASTSAGTFAYVADGYGASFATCKIGAGNCAQMQIIDIHDPKHPTLISNFLVPTSSTPFVLGSGGQAKGNAIFYSEGFVYLGLTKTASGPEFIIIDASDPTSPHFVGSYPIGHDVNDIIVRGNLAYIAHPSNNTERQMLTVLDISDPRNPTYLASYYSGDPNANGKSMSIVGTTIYFGTTVSSSKAELFSLDLTHLPTFTPLKTTEIGSSAVGLNIRGDTISILTTKQNAKPGQFEILDASTMSLKGSVALPGGTNASGATLDCEDNFQYVGSVDQNNKGYLSVITAHL